MQTTHAAKLSLIGLVGVLALAGCKKNEPVAAPAPVPAPTTTPVATAPAVNVQSINIGTSEAADKSVAAQSVITSRDPIIVSINTQGTASNVPVTARLTYQDGQVAGEQNGVLNTTGSGTTNLTFSNANAWPAGKYNVHVTVDGKTVGLAQQIEVR